MTANVPDVTAWQPQALITTADGLDTLERDLNEHYYGLAKEQDVLAEIWDGPAASAAAARVVQEGSLGKGVSGALSEIGTQFRAASRILDGARQHLVATVTNARGQGFTVHDDGVVDPAGKLSWLAIAPPETRDAARIQIEEEAAALTAAVVDALRQANDAATEASKLIKGAISELEDAGAKAVAGDVITVGNDKFTLKPDIPTTTAASAIGVMADGTKAALTTAAVSSGDDVAKYIGKGMGPFGAAIGTVPAIMADIDGGMDADKAIVSESAGAVAGLTAGWLGGALTTAALGSAVPGVGTVGGFVVGAVAGGFASHFASKGVQAAWD
ncbi:MAG: hypothetical protein GX610_20105 [Rhodococcus sp.]|nr:hypothetical protein [Rhodococcus sp. (in: high G+C Gram-positive bacteria)]